MDVLVTGATGFVGSHLAEALLAGGDRVRCLARPRSDRRWLPQGATLSIGSLDDPASLAAAVSGVEAVYHLAALTSATRRADYDEVNHRGVVRLLEALRSHAPRARLVFCSSLAAGGPARSGRPLTEADPPAPVGPYGESKARAELAVAASGLDAVTVRPPAVYGPRDQDVLAVFRMVARGLAVRTGPRAQQLAFIHVQDLVQGLLRAGRTASARGVYYVNGANHCWEDIVASIAAAVGRRPMIVAASSPVIRVAGHAAAAWGRLTGRKPLLTPERAWDLVQPNWTCDDARARAELGYAPTVELSEGTRLTAAWYREQGWM